MINPDWFKMHIGLISIMILLVCSVSYADMEDGAIIHDKVITCRIKGGDEIETTFYENIEILNKDGLIYGLKIIEESYLIELEDFKAEFFDADGELIKEVEKDDGTRVCGFGVYEVYTDYCYTVFAFTPDNFPVTVKRSYKLKQKTLFQWQDWMPQDIVPVRHAKYTIIADDDFDFRYKSSEMIPPPDSLVSDGRKNYVWELTDIAPLEEGEFSQYLEYGGMVVRFAPPAYKIGKYKFDCSDWRTLSRDNYVMVYESFELDDKQKRFMDEIISQSDNETEICSNLHRSMSDLTRYFAVHIGVGGWLPHKSKDTFKYGYGDCKDLSTMYVSMLRYAGIDAKYVLLARRDAGMTDPEFPSLARFNHAILFAVLDGDTVWIDPTVNICDIGDLPWGDENTYALVVDPAQGCLVRTDSSTADENLISRKVEMWPKSNRSMTVNMEYELSGNARNLFDMAIGSSTESSDADGLRNNIFELSDRFIVDSIYFPKVELEKPVHRLKVWGKVRSAVHRIGKEEIMDLTVLDYESRIKRHIDPQTYQQPFEFLFPRKFVDTVIIHLPDSKKVVELPDSADIASDIGAFKIETMLQDSAIVITREISNFQYRVMPDSFADYFDFMDEINALGDCFIKLGRK